MAKKVFVGLSGGVDSSLSAALLKEQGHEVIGVYMKNWSKDLPGFDCPWKQDYLDAKRVAVQLGIGFQMFDFEKEYFDLVVQYMLDGFKDGITPNPDIMCNQEIKFKLFLEASLIQGAEFIATGHYAQIEKQIEKVQPSKEKENVKLKMAIDKNKDQTYFLYRVTGEALSKTVFPLGEFTKPQVREMAKQRGLVTATKKESMGICFVGKVGIKEFLQNYVITEAGAIIDQNGQTIGEHDGAIFYTIGQRHGLDVGGGMPYYVTAKSMAKNEVYVTNNIDDHKLWSSSANLTSLHWINDVPKDGGEYSVRFRHRAPLLACRFVAGQDGASLVLPDQVRALTPGQSAVLYDGEICIGGGIIC